MRAIVDGKPIPVFEESPQRHTQLFHPDAAETLRERIILEEQMRLRLAQLGPSNT